MKCDYEFTLIICLHINECGSVVCAYTWLSLVAFESFYPKWENISRLSDGNAIHHRIKGQWQTQLTQLKRNFHSESTEILARCLFLLFSFRSLFLFLGRKHTQLAAKAFGAQIKIWIKFKIKKKTIKHGEKNSTDEGDDKHISMYIYKAEQSENVARKIWKITASGYAIRKWGCGNWPQESINGLLINLNGVITKPLSSFFFFCFLSLVPCWTRAIRKV